MLSKADQDFLSLAQQHHGIELSSDEMMRLHRHVWESNQMARERLAPAPVVAYNKVIGKIFLAAGFAALGAFFLPGAIAGIGIFQAVLIGATIGYALGGLLFDRRKKIDQREETPLFEFSGTGEIVLLGEPIPTIYANRTINPSGGVVFSQPPTLYSRIFSASGAQYLRRIVMLSAGKLGLVNESDLTLDQQSRSLFGTGDIETQLNLSNNHSPAPGAPTRYSQAIRANTNAFFGLDKTLQVFEINASQTPSFSNLTNVTNPATTTNLNKSGGTDGSFDGSAETQSVTLPSQLNSWTGVTFTLDSLQDLEVGLAATVPTFDASILFDLSGTFEVYVGGVLVTSGTYAVLDDFSVRHYRGIPSNGFVFLQNNEAVHIADTAIGDTVTPYFRFATNGSGVEGVEVHENTAPTSTSSILSGYGRRFTAGGSDLEDIDTQILYRALLEEFRIVSKTETYIETDISIYLAKGKATGIYRAQFETTKFVSAIELTFRYSLFARDKDGELIDHGMAWEVYLQKKGESEQSLGRFFVASKREKGIRRSMIISGLPLAIYSVRIEPLTSDEISTSLPRLGDSATIAAYDSGVTVDGEIVYLEYDKRSDVAATEIKTIINQQANPKIQTSNEQGPTGTLTHVNELIDPVDIGKPATIRYKNHSTAYSSVLASDRIQSAPTEGWAIDEGNIIRQYLSHGYATNTSTATQIDDINAHFVDDGVAVGDRIRVLKQSKNRVITAISNLSATVQAYSISITTALDSPLITVSAGDYATILEGMPINAVGVPDGAYAIAKIAPDQICLGDEWDREILATASGTVTATFNSGVAPEAAEEYIVFSMGSSPYFPDQYVDRLINPVSGMGQFIDQDRYVDYWSIVYSRRFCATNQFFHEAILTGGSFEDWATEAAPASLLFVTRINGKYALIPEQDQPISGIFNSGNLIEYSEPYVPWIEQEINTLLLKYKDREGRDKQIKIQTQAAANSGIEISRTINLPGVKNPAQVERVGVLALNSLRFQNRVCQLTSDVQTLNLQQGQLIRTQHVITEYELEASGRIMAAGSPVNNRTETTPTIAAIANTQDGGSRIIVTTARPHELRDTDQVVIAGTGTIDGTYTPTIYDPSRFSIPIPFVSSSGGTVARRRAVFDQSVVLSGGLAIPTGYRISVGTVLGCQADLIAEESGGQIFVRGLETPIAQNDLYTLGQDAYLDRNWRVSSIDPDVMNNTVKVSCALWISTLNDSTGLVIT